jgi:hypothetical protein
MSARFNGYQHVTGLANDGTTKCGRLTRDRAGHEK